MKGRYFDVLKNLIDDSELNDLDSFNILCTKIRHSNREETLYDKAEELIALANDHLGLATQVLDHVFGHESKLSDLAKDKARASIPSDIRKRFFGMAKSEKGLNLELGKLTKEIRRHLAPQPKT